MFNFTGWRLLSGLIISCAWSNPKDHNQCNSPGGIRIIQPKRPHISKGACVLHVLNVCCQYLPSAYVVCRKEKFSIRSVCPSLCLFTMAPMSRLPMIQFVSMVRFDPPPPPPHGSCTAEVEFEFNSWVRAKATADFHSGSGQPVSYCLLMYANECREKSYHQLPFRQWPWTQAQVVNSNSTSTE